MLMDMSRDQLLRKVRDLLNQQEKNETIISNFKQEVRALSSHANTLQDGIEDLKREHNYFLDEAKEGSDNRITAMSQLHADVLNNKNTELRSIAKLAMADKKAHNLVSTIVPFSLDASLFIFISHII